MTLLELELDVLTVKRLEKLVVKPVKIVVRVACKSKLALVTIVKRL